MTAALRFAGLSALLAVVVGIPTLILCALLAAVIGPFALIPFGLITWGTCRRVRRSYLRERRRLGRT